MEGFLDWAVGKELWLMNTCFQKRKSWLLTFRLGETETMVDYVLVNNCEFETVSPRLCSVWKKFRELSCVLARKHSLSLKQRGKIYQCCVRPILFC